MINTPPTRRLWAASCMILILVASGQSHAQDALDDLLYYQIGGGQALAGPASYRRNTTIRSAGGVSLGYSCGSFDLSQNLKSSFNNLTRGRDRAVDSLTYAASSGMQSVPLYLLRQANPNLANMLENMMLRYEEEFRVGVKSCRQAEKEIMDGKNPYYDWVKIGRKDTWQKAANAGETVDQIQERVDDEHGCVTWLDGREYLCPGGDGGPEINVVEDVTAHGYALTRETTTTTSPAAASSGGGLTILTRETTTTTSPGGGRLTQVWRTPEEAVAAVRDLVGGYQITNIRARAPVGKPGRGAGAVLHEMALDIRQEVQAAVRKVGHAELTAADLTESDASGLVISPALIEALADMNPDLQATAIERISMELALLKAMERVNLARRLIITGMSDPNVAASPARELLLTEVLPRLEQESQLLTDEYELRQRIAHSTASVVIEQQLARKYRYAPVRTGRFVPPLEGGAQPVP